MLASASLAVVALRPGLEWSRSPRNATRSARGLIASIAARGAGAGDLAKSLSTAILNEASAPAGAVLSSQTPLWSTPSSLIRYQYDVEGDSPVSASFSVKSAVEA